MILLWSVREMKFIQKNNKFKNHNKRRKLNYFSIKNEEINYLFIKLLFELLIYSKFKCNFYLLLLLKMF